MKPIHRVDLNTRDVARHEERSDERWTGPVIRRDPTHYQLASTVPVRCRHCGEWSRPVVFTCGSCRGPYPGGIP